MNRYLLTAATSVALALPLIAAPALAVDHDGGLPLYPRGHVAQGMGDMPASALAAGVPYQQTTTDSIHLVDLWFKSNAPKACSRVTVSGNPAVQYKCPGGSIVIQDHGGTLISYVPAFGLPTH
jgi:hypothetical protein